MSDSPSQPCATAQRDRSIRLAVITSLVSKLGTIVMRLVSIPIAIRLLGMEMFGVYTAITLAVGMIDFLHIGIGPALTKELSKAVARNDREREKTVFATSILISTALTLIVAVAVAVLLLALPIPTIFGEKFAPVSDVMFRAAWIGMAIILIELICTPFEMGRDGYQETRFNNSWGAFGNIVGAVALLCGIWFFPTIEFLLITVNGSLALAKLCNTIHLLIQRPYLLPRFSLFRRKLIRPLAIDGMRFSVTYILAAAIEYNVMAFLIGRFVGPEAVGVYNVMITVHFSLTGIVGMFTRPYWPALMDAHERDDLPWIRKTTRQLRLIGLGFGTLTALGLIVLGPYLLPLWAGKEFYDAVSPDFEMGRLALAAFSAYFAAHIWRHINQIFALGVGQITPVVRTVIGEAAFLLAAAGSALYFTGRIALVYGVMFASLLLFSGWIFPLLFRRGLHTGPESEPRSPSYSRKAANSAGISASNRTSPAVEG